MDTAISTFVPPAPRAGNRPEPVERLTKTRLDPVVRAAARGDKGAVAQLLTLVTPVVVRYCRARLGRRDLAYLSADDVAQETCFAVLRALSSYQDRGGSFLYLVHAIAANKVADAFRLASRERAEPTPDVPEAAVDTKGPEYLALTGDLGRRLGELLETLPATQRDILILRVVVGLSAGATGEALGISAGNVRTSQHRALTKLRALIACDPDF